MLGGRANGSEMLAHTLAIALITLGAWEPAASIDRCSGELPYRTYGNQVDLDPILVHVIRGQVLDPGGEPVPGSAFCVGLYSDTPIRHLATTTADARGRFEFKRVQSGTYRIGILIDGLGAPRLRVTGIAGDESLLGEPAGIELPLFTAIKKSKPRMSPVIPGPIDE